jgi:hypothetical protein
MNGPRTLAARFMFAGLLFAGPASQCFAQTPPTPAESNDWSVETVTVTARSAGPAVWHATKASADVAILGIVEPMPEHFTWNTAPLARLLDASNLLLLPPRAEANIFKGLWFLLTERDLLSPPDGKTLWDILPPPLASRFAVARDMLHEDKDRYDDDAPAIAALRLEGDFLRTNAMTVKEPEDTIRSLARARDVEVREVATYDALPGAEEVLKLPPETTTKCVDAAVSDVDIASAHAAAAAEAWAVGDLAGIKANYSQPRIYDCLVELSPLVTALDKRAIDDTVKEIMAAIDEGGHAVAVVGIGLLLRKNGVLERLAAAGVTVAAPKE